MNFLLAVHELLLCLNVYRNCTFTLTENRCKYVWNVYCENDQHFQIETFIFCMRVSVVLIYIRFFRDLWIKEETCEIFIKLVCLSRDNAITHNCIQPHNSGFIYIFKQILGNLCNSCMLFPESMTLFNNVSTLEQVVYKPLDFHSSFIKHFNRTSKCR